jgi:hypothetical protein
MVPLNMETYNYMNIVGNRIINKTEPSELYINLYNKAMQLFSLQLSGVNIQETNLYLWDEVCMIIAFKLVKSSYKIYYTLVNADGSLLVYSYDNRSLPKKMFSPSKYYLCAKKKIYLKTYINNILNNFK